MSGPYDFKLEFSAGRLSTDGDIAAPAPDVFTALEKQLGLKLERTTVLLDLLVIEQLQRKVTEN